MVLLSRRSFLAAAAGGLIIGCGGGSSAGPGGTSAGGPAAGGPAALTRFFPDGIYLAGRPERLPFSLADAEGIPLSGGPERLTVDILDAGGRAVVSGQEVARRAVGLPRAYYPVELTGPDAGLYTATATVDGRAFDADFTLAAPGSLPFPGAGDPMPALATPTLADPAGVDPICTRTPACPFHDVSLADALGQGPVAFLVGTPAHCQTAICGPVLDVMMSLADAAPGVRFIHAEVYADETLADLAPVVTALELPFEPLLFLIDGEGAVRQRFDVIFDRSELNAALASLPG